MIATLTNRTTGPFDIESLTGTVRLPANGHITGDFDPEYLTILEAFGMVGVNREAQSVEARRGRPRKERR